MQFSDSLKATRFQPLNLSRDFLVSKFAFTFNLYRYNLGVVEEEQQREGWGCTS
jgi:hypothetical protein